MDYDKKMPLSQRFGNSIMGNNQQEDQFQKDESESMTSYESNMDYEEYKPKIPDNQSPLSQ